MKNIEEENESQKMIFFNCCKEIGFNGILKVKTNTNFTIDYESDPECKILKVIW